MKIGLSIISDGAAGLRPMRFRRLRWICAKTCPVIIIMIAVALVLGVASPTQQAARATQTSATEAGNAENGKRLYIKYGCYECHSYQGQGSIASGPRIGPDPVPLPAFTAYVRQPAGNMPPYSNKLLSDHDLADINAFLKSLPEPRSAKTIPLLNYESEAKPPEGTNPNERAAATRSFPVPEGTTQKMVELGERIYRGQVGGVACTGCHGESGQGTPLGPTLTAHKWLWSDGSYAGIKKTIIDGVSRPKQYRGPMPASGAAQLTPDQVSAVAAYA